MSTLISRIRKGGEKEINFHLALPDNCQVVVLLLRDNHHELCKVLLNDDQCLTITLQSCISYSGPGASTRGEHFVT